MPSSPQHWYPILDYQGAHSSLVFIYPFTHLPNLAYSLTQFCSILLRFFAADGFVRHRRSAGNLRCSQTHFDLELLDQLAGLHLFRFLFDLDLLLVHVAHGHIHASFIDSGDLVDLAHHLVMGFADARHFKLLHHVCNFLLPLRTAIIGNRAERFLGLAVFLAHESLLHRQGFFESSAGGGQLSLGASQSALCLLQLRGKTARNIVAVGLDGGFNLGRQFASVIFIFSFFALQQRDVSFDHGNALIHARHLVVHVTNVLLQDHLGIFSN